MSIAYPEDDRFLRGLIRRKVDQLIRRPGFDPQDRHDFETDLLLRVLQSLPAYDPLKSHPYVFFTTVVERYIANLVRNRSVAKRDDSGIWSLNVTVHLNKEEVIELAQEVGERELSSRTGWYRRPETELSELGMDVGEVMADLPGELRKLCEELMAGKSVSQIAREWERPRTTLNDRVREIRLRFESKGLKNY